MALDLVQLTRELGLFLFEQVKGDGSFVVGVEETASSVLDVGTPRRQGAHCLGLVPFDLSQLVVEVVLDLRSVLRAELDSPVELYYPVFDDVDEDGFEGAVVEAAAAGADEVGVDGALAVLGVLDGQARPTRVDCVSYDSWSSPWKWSRCSGRYAPSFHLLARTGRVHLASGFHC